VAGGYTAAHRMPARRPYASRGVPRRATTRRPGAVASATGLAALVAVLAATAVSVIWLGHLWPPDAQISGPLTVGAISSDSRGSASVTVPQTQPNILQMADVSGPAPTPRTDAAGTPLPTPVALATLRRWDTQAPGVVTDLGLVTRLDQALAGVDGHVSLAVKDLGSGRGAVLDGDR
jgi:hypothetical protein